MVFPSTASPASSNTSSWTPGGFPKCTTPDQSDCWCEAAAKSSNTSAFDHKFVNCAVSCNTSTFNMSNAATVTTAVCKCLFLTPCPTLPWTEILPGTFGFLFLLLAVGLASIWVMERIKFRPVMVAFWIASFDWQPVSVYRVAGPILTMLTYALFGVIPIIMAVWGWFTADTLQPFYQHERDVQMLSFALVLVVGASLLTLYGVLAWRNDEWLLSTHSKISFVGAGCCFLGVFVSYFVRYYGKKNTDYYGTAWFFLTINLFPMITIAFSKAEDGLPLDIVYFIKRYAGKRGLRLVYRCIPQAAGEGETGESGALPQGVPGVYTARLDDDGDVELSDGCPIYQNTDVRSRINNTSHGLERVRCN